ncbi:MAG: DMT family transporter [Alphaproteobacteria bacterium]|nr:DMT family transporter [Alphaproteobacteria bacterium]
MASKTANSILVATAPWLFVVLWATGFVVAKLSAGHVAPVWFLGLRFPIACLFMLGVALYQRAAWPDVTHAFHAAVAGAFMHGGYLAPIYWAVAHGLPAGVSALIVGLQPLLTAFLAAFIVGERIHGRHWLGLLVGLLGIALVISPKLHFSGIEGITPLTVALALAGALSISFGTVYQKRFATGVGLATGGTWQYVGGSLVVLIAAYFVEDFFFDNSAQAWFALGWAVIVLSIISITLMMMLIRDGAVSKVSSLIFLVPAVAALMTFALFGETLNLIQILGMAVCAAAVLIVNRKG